MASHQDYLIARDLQEKLARRAERVRQARDGVPVQDGSRAGRLLRRLLARSEQRELLLTPGGVERAPVPAGRLELE